MGELGLTEAERKMALVDPGFSTAGVTTGSMRSFMAMRLSL